MRRLLSIVLSGLSLVAGASAWAQELNPLGLEFLVNDCTEGDQYVDDVAVDSYGTFVALWSDYGRAVTGVYGQRYDANGSAQGTSFRVNPDTVAGAGGRLEMDGSGNSVIVWLDTSPATRGVYARRYTSEGMPMGERFRVSDPILWEVAYPEVAVATDGSFVITWTSYRAAGRYDVYARRFSAQGEPQGNEFRVNDQTDADQLWPDVALGPDGGFVITWDDFASTGDVWARRYGPSGTPLGTQFRVNTHLPRLQVRPSIASDEEGRFVVVWASSDQDGHVTGIYAQRFSADGERIGEEFRVNTNTYHYQDNPELHVNPDGSFAIVWMSFAQDGSNYGVFAQAYDRLGAPVGEEFQVNTYTQGDQQFPSVTGGNGTLVIVWTSGVQDGSSSGVYGQRYAWEGVHIEAPSDARTAISARPNPANGLATATLSLAEPSAAVKVAVLDVLGRQMMVLHDGPLAAGTHRLSVDVSAWPVGVYVLRAEGVGAALAQRFTVVR